MIAWTAYIDRMAWKPPREPGHEADLPLTFCDQCGHLQVGLRAVCERCCVPLDRSVYDPFVAIHQNAAVVRQAIRGGAKPSAFGKAALIGLAFLYLAYSAVALGIVVTSPLSLDALVFVVLDLAIGMSILSAFHRMRSRDSWSEYLDYS